MQRENYPEIKNLLPQKYRNYEHGSIYLPAYHGFVMARRMGCSINHQIFKLRDLAAQLLDPGTYSTDKTNIVGATIFQIFIQAQF